MKVSIIDVQVCTDAITTLVDGIHIHVQVEGSDRAALRRFPITDRAKIDEYMAATPEKRDMLVRTTLRQPIADFITEIGLADSIIQVETQTLAGEIINTEAIEPVIVETVAEVVEQSDAAGQE